MTDLTREEIEDIVKGEFLPENEDLLTLARLALEALDQREQGGWQDISSAPKDGTEFWAWVEPASIASINRKKDIERCRYNGVRLEYSHAHGWFSFREENYLAKRVRHWMPLPDAPTPPQEQEG